jgi:UDP-GlcNAc:undecaprenyl-phosphate GlcNAc-1-phosphate transferase
MNNLLSFYIFVFFLNLLIIYKFKLISNFFNLYDEPNSKRKIHKKKVATLGGTIFFLTFITLFFYLTILNEKNIFFYDNFFNISFFIPIFVIFFIGLYDDRYHLKAELKLFLIGILIFVILKIDTTLIVKELYFSSFDRSINLGVLSIPFTILCFLLFMNALNMFDGINLQAGTYFLFILVYFFVNYNFYFLILVILIPVITFLILNFYEKSFLGDSGSLLIAYLMCYLTIKTYNFEYIDLTIEKIFILMMLPGLDMFRLFLERIFNKRNPFKPDNKHIHHLLINKYKYKKTFLIIQAMIFLPIIVTIFFDDIFGLILGCVFYAIFLKSYNFKY